GADHWVESDQASTWYFGGGELKCGEPDWAHRARPTRDADGDLGDRCGRASGSALVQKVRAPCPSGPVGGERGGLSCVLWWSRRVSRGGGRSSRRPSGISAAYGGR